MAIKLTCPGCRDAVQAGESDRGKKIKCGTCWTDVDVPAPVLPAKAAPLPTAKAVPATPVAAAKPVASAAPTAAPVPAAGPKKATPLPASPTPAKPVVAAALPATAAKPAAPVVPKPKAKVEETESKKPRFKERDRGRDDDDEDDDTPRTKKKGSGGVMIAFICIGAVMLMMVAGGIAVIVMNNGSGSAAATTSLATTGQVQPNFNPPVGGGIPIPPRNPGDFNPGGGGGGGGDPLPAPKPPAIRPQGWAEYKGKDFTCDMPGGVNKAADKFTYATREVSGTTYTAGDQNNAIRVTVKELLLPVGTSATSSAFVAAAFAVPVGDLKKDAGRLVSGNDGIEYKLTTADGDENAIVAVGVGTRNAFLFRYQWKPNTPTAEEKRDNFLASLTVLLEGEVPVARDPFGGRPDPRQPKPIDGAWRPIENKDGFSVDVPNGGKKGERNLVDLENRLGLVNGKKWTTDDGDVMYHVYYHDLTPEQLELDQTVLMKGIIRPVFAYGLQGSGEATKVDGKAATRWDVKELNGNITHGVSVRVGYRVFTMFVTGMRNNKGETVNDRQDRFLNSIKITFDPKTHKPYADDPEWVAMAKAIGFTALIPKQATSAAEFKPFFFDEAPKGREWKADIDGILYQVFVVDFSLRPGRNQLTNKTPQDLVDHLTNKKPESGPEKSKLGTLNADAYTVKVHGDHLSFLRFAASGNLVYVAKTSRGHDWNNKVGDKEYADKTARFFEAFRLGEGVIAPGGGLPGGIIGGGGFGGATGEFAKLGEARVQPFWTGVFLPQKKEFITFGVKDATARPPIRGVVRRYSVPDFKLKATYETASPINRVSADETNGRLFAATVQQAADAKASEKDNLIATGDVQQFDLLKLTDGSLTEGERVTPANVIQSSNTAFRVSGLEASADGSAVYISGVTVSGKSPNLMYRGKLLKWDTATRKMQDDIATDLPVWALAVSADGKKVIGVERNMDPAKAVGSVIVVDGPGWKKLTPVPLLGVPSDVAFRSDRVAVVVSGGQAGGRLLVGPVDGDLSETTPGGEVNCVRFTPGGTKLLVSAGGQSSGLTMFEVDAAKPPKLTKVAAANELGGLFVISADGKIAVTNTGAVLDLEKSKAK